MGNHTSLSKFLHRYDPEGGSSGRSVAVIGLGRFGSSLALELMDWNTEVLGVDINPEVVQQMNTRLTHVVAANAAKSEVLEQLAVAEFDRVVVAIGTDLESSILVTSQLIRAGVQHIWAKAVSDQHGTILEQLGVRHVIYPEKDMGRRVAHLVRGSLKDFIPIDRDFVLVKSSVPRKIVGVPLDKAKVRQEYGVTISAVRRPTGEWVHTEPGTVLGPDDVILVSGPTDRAERFAQLCAS